MRRTLTRQGLLELMKELARSCPRDQSYRVYIVGGGTVVHVGWRDSTIDADHYDPYAQLLSKVVRGFRRDMEDAHSFLESGMVDADRFSSLVHQIPEEAYAGYPAVSRQAVLEAVDAFLSGAGS